MKIEFLIEGTFLLGVLVGGWYSSWFVGRLKKRGYLKFELTDKFIEKYKQDISKKNHEKST